MRFLTLASGSRGNATLVEGGDTRVLVDCGLGVREAERRCAAVGVSPAGLTAIILTHEHTDHVRGVLPLARRHGLLVYSTPGTWRAAGGDELPGLRLMSGHEPRVRIGDLRITPFPVPHDAREPCQLIFEHDGARLGILTDTGSITPHVRGLLGECTGLILELNHDEAMLRAGPYPPSLRARVGGAYGHLSNRQAAELLDHLPSGQLRQLLVAHMSERNNHPDRVREALRSAPMAPGSAITLAEQDRPSAWLEI